MSGSGVQFNIRGSSCFVLSFFFPLRHALMGSETPAESPMWLKPSICGNRRLHTVGSARLSVQLGIWCLQLPEFWISYCCLPETVCEKWLLGHEESKAVQKSVMHDTIHTCAWLRAAQGSAAAVPAEQRCCPSELESCVAEALPGVGAALLKRTHRALGSVRH